MCPAADFDLQYAPAPERLPVALQERYGLFLNGRFVAPRSRRWFATLNPATGQPLTQLAAAGAADVRAAVQGARRAHAGWARLSGAQRAAHLFRLARLLQEHLREFAVLEALEGGKPIREARDGDLPLAVQHLFYHAGWADKLRYAMPGGGQPQPLGVVGAIIPWNFPTLMLAWKLGPALACGNTVVLKPAETTSLTALRFAQLCQEAELPPGVVQILTGDGTTGRLLAQSPLDKLAFTGSTAVGRVLANQAGRRELPVTLELGGKSANLVFADAALHSAVEGIVDSIFYNRGHVCCAGSRLLVQESIQDELLDRLQQRMQSLRLGDPLDKNTDVGPINSAEQLQTIQQLCRSGQEQGANSFQLEVRLPKQGFWFAPTVLTGVTPAMRVAQEEIFGPVLSVTSFRTPQEAIDLANNTPYGLAAGVWTDKGAKALQVASQLRAGVVWQNTYNRFDPSAPFGGVRESGWGREGGAAGLLPYLRSGA